MIFRKPILMLSLAVGLLGALLLVVPVSAGGPPDVESPPEGMHPSEFATENQGCLGSLRSAIARGEFDGTGPFGKHFTGNVNPGVHQGTVGEEEFLANLLADLFGEEAPIVEEFCAGFE